MGSLSSFKPLALLAILLAAAQSSGALAAGAPVSRYQAIDKCRVIESNEEEDWSRTMCPAVGGIAVEVQYGDAREDIVLHRPRSNTPLNLARVVGGGFNTLGPTLEWRGTVTNNRFTPRSLIVRNRIVEDPAQDGVFTSFLMVIDLPRNCVVALVRPGPRQNQEARAIADGAARDCMTGTGGRRTG